MDFYYYQKSLMLAGAFQQVFNDCLDEEINLEQSWQDAGLPSAQLWITMASLPGWLVFNARSEEPDLGPNYNPTVSGLLELIRAYHLGA